jgi:hypothetical protein
VLEKRGKRYTALQATVGSKMRDQKEETLPVGFRRRKKP